VRFGDSNPGCQQGQHHHTKYHACTTSFNRVGKGKKQYVNAPFGAPALPTELLLQATGRARTGDTAILSRSITYLRHFSNVLKSRSNNRSGAGARYEDSNLHHDLHHNALPLIVAKYPVSTASLFFTAAPLQAPPFYIDILLIESRLVAPFSSAASTPNILSLQPAIRKTSWVIIFNGDCP